MSVKVDSQNNVATFRGEKPPLYPISFGMFIQGDAGQNNMYSFRDGATQLRRMQFISNGNTLRMKTSGDVTDNLDVSPGSGNRNNWKWWQGVWRSGSDREAWAFLQDGTEFTATSTTSVSETNENDDINIFPASVTAYVEHFIVWGADVSPDVGRAIAAGRHPLDFSQLKEYILFYQPLNAGWNEYPMVGPTVDATALGPPLTVGTISELTPDVRRFHTLPVVPPILTVAAGGSVTRVLDEDVEIISGTKWIRGLIKVADSVEEVVGSALRVLGIVRVVDSTVEVLEGLVRRLGMTRITNEVEEVVGTQLRLLGLVRLKGETEEVVDSQLKVLGLVRVKGETEEVLEGLISVLGLVRLMAETVEITDEALRFLGLAKVSNETVEILDSALNIRGLIQLVAETVEVSEGLVRKITAVVVGAILGLTYGYFNIKAKASATAFSINAKIKATFKMGDGGESSV